MASETAAASVLLVDDEPAMLSAMRRTLRSLPLKIRTASCADEALALIDVEVPRLVLSDFQMSGMNGLEFLEKVKKRHPAVACILHTGAASIPSEFGVDIPVLAKPCEPEVLKELVLALVGEPTGI